MTDWCTNIVEVSFDNESEKKDFKNFVEDETSRFSFKKILPEPKDLSDRQYGGESFSLNMKNDFTKKYGSTCLYDWRILNWGVKWVIDEEDCRIEESKNCIRYDFSTTYNPATGIYLKLIENFPDLNITWQYDFEGLDDLYDGYFKSKDREPLAASLLGRFLVLFIYSDSINNHKIFKGFLKWVKKKTEFSIKKSKKEGSRHLVLVCQTTGNEYPLF